MEWTDQAIIIGTRRHGESSLIVELMTEMHGRHLGLVRGGRSRRRQAELQPGNSVHAVWRARLDEHLGNLTLEAVRFRAAELMPHAAALYGLELMAGLLRLLPERDPHPGLYAALAVILEDMAVPAATAELMVRFELQILNELGFGLDLTRCAATGNANDLAFVSPRTGRAVGRAAGEPYAGRLLDLPSFLIARDPGDAPAPDALVAGFRLTGFFLEKHVYEPRGLAAPPARASLIALLRHDAP